MELLQLYGKEIISSIIPLVIWILNTFFKSRAQLIFAKPHEFTFLIQEPLYDDQKNLINASQTASTISHLIFNTGRKTATNVEITFNWKPMHINIWPTRMYRENIDKDGRYTLILENLTPKEGLTCELLSVNNRLPELLSVRSDQCVGKSLNMLPQPILSNWQRRTYIALLILGVSSAIYWLITILQLVILHTPI